jgi:heme exporter protein D
VAAPGGEARRLMDLDAGPYAAFVWPAYGVSALVIAGLALDSWLRARRWRREAERGRKDP